MRRILSPRLLGAVGACSLTASLFSTKKHAHVAFAQEHESDEEKAIKEAQQLSPSARIRYMKEMGQKEIVKSPIERLKEYHKEISVWYSLLEFSEEEIATLTSEEKEAHAALTIGTAARVLKLPMLEHALKTVDDLPEPISSKGLHILASAMAYHLAEWEKVNLHTAKAGINIHYLEKLNVDICHPNYKDVAESLIWFKNSTVFNLLDLDMDELKQQYGYYDVSNYREENVFLSSPTAKQMVLQDSKPGGMIVSGAVATLSVGQQKFSGLVSMKKDGAMMLRNELSLRPTCQLVREFMLSKVEPNSEEWNGYLRARYICSSIALAEAHSEVRMRLSKQEGKI